MDILQPFERLEACFGELEDPRVPGRCDPVLTKVILVAVCAVLCAAESWSQGEPFGRTNEEWRKHYLTLPTGIPSHDTFGRVVRRLAAGAFQARFREWIERVFNFISTFHRESIVRYSKGTLIAESKSNAWT